MTQVNHSGDNCSGMCEAPCMHESCWQCQEPQYAAARAKKLQAMQQAELEKQQRELKRLAAQKAAKKVAPNILSNMTGRKTVETTTITREALEALAKRANVEVKWNSGSPIIRDPNLRGQPGALVDGWWPIERADKLAVVPESKPGVSAEDLAAAKAVLQWEPKEQFIVMPAGRQSVAEAWRSGMLTRPATLITGAGRPVQIITTKENS